MFSNLVSRCHGVSLFCDNQNCRFIHAQKNPCHGCGKKVQDSLLEKYIKDKMVWSKVLPTCGADKCLIHKKIKWKTQMKRKVDKEWEHKNWMNRKLKVLEKKKEAKRNERDRNQQ